MPRRLPGRAIQAGTITVTQLETTVATTVQTGGGPKITTVQVTSNSYVVLDDTAVDIAGGYIKITGTGFAAGCQVLINNTPATSTTYIGPTEVRAQLPATAAGTYMLYLINADGGVAIRVNGVTFSATPSWVTASDLTSYALGDAISIQLSATGASTFALAAGSTLPTGLTLSAGGLLSGSVTGLENDTSYSFTITATDAENQDSPRTFTISITVQLQVSRSLRFNSADSAHVLRTFGATGNLQTFSVSCWFKRSALGASNPIFVAGTDTADYMFIAFTGGDIISVITGETGTTNLNLINSTAVFRDTAAWYHLVVAFDFANATSTDRIRVFVNGVRQTMTGTYASSSFTGTRHNRAGILHYIGRWPTGSSFFNGYITEFYFIDGLALDPTSFAETNTATGQYIPKKYTGTYGTNGFYLPFTDNSSVLNLGRNYQPLTADPFWNRTVLLLNGTGTNNANNNSFTDSSTNAFAITRNGNVSQGRFSPFTQGGWSNYFNGSSSLTPSSGSFLAFGTSNYTIEFWVFLTQNVGNNHALAINANNGLVVVIGDGKTSINSYNVGDVVATTTGLAVNVWNHVAIVRSGTGANQTAIYINGIRAALGTDATNWSVTTNPRIGGNTTSQYMYGYLNNIRVVTSAVYTNNFIPPTSPLQAIAGTTFLTGQSNRFIDLGSTGATFTTTGSPSVVAFSPFTPTTAYSAATNGGSAYFDGSGDYLTAGSDAAFAYGTGAYTVEFWMYPSNLNLQVFLVNLTTNGLQVWYDTTQGIAVGAYGSSPVITTGTGFFLASQWNHVVVTRASTSAGQAAIFINGTRRSSGTDANNYTITGPLNIGGQGASNVTTGYMSSLRLVKGTAVYDPTQTTLTVPTAPVTAVANTSLLLNFTNAGIVDATGDNNIETVGDAKISTVQSKWAGSSMLFDGTGDNLFIGSGARNFSLGTSDFTIECWFRHNGVQNSDSAIFSFSNANFFVCHNNATSYNNLITVWIDPYSAGLRALTGTTTLVDATWYHLAISRAGGVWRLFLNGVQEATYTNSADPLPAGAYLTIGSRQTGNYYYKGYIQDFRITLAARYTGNFTPPTAQFAYNQGDINYNQWVPTNFSVTAGAGNDSLLDVPTNWGVDTGLGGEVRGNYCTWNVLEPSLGTRTIANGALDVANSGNGNTYGNFGMTTGKWYFECTLTAQSGATGSCYVGLTASAFSKASGSPQDRVPGIGYCMDGTKNLDATVTSYGATYAVNDIIGCAVDIDAGSVTFYKNGVSQGTITKTLLGQGTGSWIIYTVAAAGAASNSWTLNAGQRAFAYAAPSGFKSLNTHNLPALAVAKSNTVFDTMLYTGDGAASKSITGLAFQPDLVWIKSRSNASGFHVISDSVRGAGNWLTSNATNVEAGPGQLITAFNADGFSLNLTPNNTVNESGGTYVVWAWDAGTTTVVNTAGTIQSNVRVNAAAGISIVSYTGTQATATVGHGLGTAPKLILAKSRSVSNTNWVVYHNSLGSTSSLLILNSANAPMTITNYWGSTPPTSTVFGVANGVYDNNNGSMIAYCFAEVQGFSSFGGWTGNGSADGPFIYTGFRPAMIIAKQTNTSGQNWYILDSDRSPSNVLNSRLYPNLTNSEDSDGNINCDLLSNGFKIRDAYTGWNASGGTYIYIAFAESPFKYARAR